MKSTACVWPRDRRFRAEIEGLFRELGDHPEDIIAIGEKYGVTYFFDE